MRYEICCLREAQNHPARRAVLIDPTTDVQSSASPFHCQACSWSRDDAIRELALEQGVWANIAPKRIRKRTFAFSGWARRQRNLVERLLSKPKQFKGIATRYDKDSGKCLAAIKLASARIRCAKMNPLPSLGICHQIGSEPLPRADPLSSDEREVG